MPKVIFVEHNGKRHEIEGKIGHSLMETAVSNRVPGIDADCGGACACATCHVFINGEWGPRLGPRGEMEQTMLDFAENVRPTSRLACQIKVSPEMDGIVVELPKAQH